MAKHRNESPINRADLERGLSLLSHVVRGGDDLNLWGDREVLTALLVLGPAEDILRREDERRRFRPSLGVYDSEADGSLNPASDDEW